MDTVSSVPKTAQDWLVLKPEIEARINEGWSVTQLARHYQVTQRVICLVLDRFGLQTLNRQLTHLPSDGVPS